MLVVRRARSAWTSRISCWCANVKALGAVLRRHDQHGQVDCGGEGFKEDVVSENGVVSEAITLVGVYKTSPGSEEGQEHASRLLSSLGWTWII